MIEFTDWARDILARSQEASRRFNPNAKIRLARVGGGVQAVLTDRPESGDEVARAGEVTVYVERGLEGLVDVEEPHDRLVLRPHGSSPNPREGHGSGRADAE
jgi:hypothetical protein